MCVFGVEIEEEEGDGNGDETNRKFAISSIFRVGREHT